MFKEQSIRISQFICAFDYPCQSHLRPNVCFARSGKHFKHTSACRKDYIIRNKHKPHQKKSHSAKWEYKSIQQTIDQPLAKLQTLLTQAWRSRFFPWELRMKLA